MHSSIIKKIFLACKKSGISNIIKNIMQTRNQASQQVLSKITDDAERTRKQKAVRAYLYTIAILGEANNYIPYNIKTADEEDNNDQYKEMAQQSQIKNLYSSLQIDKDLQNIGKDKTLAQFFVEIAIPKIATACQKSSSLLYAAHNDNLVIDEKTGLNVFNMISYYELGLDFANEIALIKSDVWADKPKFFDTIKNQIDETKAFPLAHNKDSVKRNFDEYKQESSDYAKRTANQKADLKQASESYSNIKISTIFNEIKRAAANDEINIDNIIADVDTIVSNFKKELSTKVKI